MDVESLKWVIASGIATWLALIEPVSYSNKYLFYGIHYMSSYIWGYWYNFLEKFLKNFNILRYKFELIIFFSFGD